MATYTVKKRKKQRRDRTSNYTYQRDRVLLRNIEEKHCSAGLPYINRFGRERVPLVLCRKRLEYNAIRCLDGYKRVPTWNELTQRAKLEIDSLTMWQERCLAFSVHLNSDYLAELIAADTDILERSRDYMTLELRPFDVSHNWLVGEDRDKKGQPTDPHLHGMIQSPDPSKDEAIKAALLRVAGQGTARRPTEDRAVVIEPVYDALGWARYAMKSIGKRSDTLPDRRISFSRTASQLAKLTYETMTGAAPAASFVIRGYVLGRLTLLNLSRFRPNRRRLGMFRQVKLETAIQPKSLNISAFAVR